MSEMIERPKITLPTAVEAEVREAYEAANVILEYGSGGSTVIASELLDRTVFSVECDLDWATMMVGYFEQNPPVADVRVHYADIGETKAWAYPKTRKYIDRWHSYPTSVWCRDDFVQPDVILIDGRFRAACFLSVMVFTKAPVTVIVDDYIDRPKYKVIEEFNKPTRYIDRAAVFDVQPTSPTPDLIAALMAASVQTM